MAIGSNYHSALGFPRHLFSSFSFIFPTMTFPLVRAASLVFQRFHNQLIYSVRETVTLGYGAIAVFCTLKSVPLCKLLTRNQLTVRTSG